MGIVSKLTSTPDPILLCNELGADSSLSPSGSTHVVQSSGRTTISVKEAVQIARDNNFMGLICSSRLLVRQQCATLCLFTNIITGSRTCTYRIDQNRRPCPRHRYHRLSGRWQRTIQTIYRSATSAGDTRWGGRISKRQWGTLLQ